LLRYKERFAGAEIELDVSIIEHCPLRVAISDELAEIGHNERFIGICVDAQCARVGANFGGTRLRSPRLVSVAH
jgi:hypothetical protein